MIASTQHSTVGDRAKDLERRAEALLRDPTLLARIEDLMERRGLVGEKENRRLIFISGLGGLLGLPIHNIVKGESSGGKNTVVKKDLDPVTLDVSLTVSNGPGVKHSVDEVAAVLLDRNDQLGPNEIHYLDHVGNGNGQFDVGDLRAWLMQRGDLSGAPPLSVIDSRSSTEELTGRVESETRAQVPSIQGRAQ